jgi:hypothetical protein
MAISRAAREHFEKRYGCTIEAVVANPDILPRSAVARKHEIDVESTIGRGYVHFGKAVDADRMDEESRKILSTW